MIFVFRKHISLLIKSSIFLVDKTVGSTNSPALFIPLNTSAILTFGPATNNGISLNEVVVTTKFSLCHQSENDIAIHTEIKLLIKL